MSEEIQLSSADFEEDRYSRLRLIPWWDQERLKNATIMVVGAGAIGNELIALLKETSVAGYVSIVDLTRGGNLIRNNTHDALNPLLLIALIYLALVVALTKLLGLVERKLEKSDKS